MIENPFVSILLVTYNHERFIRQAIDGVMMQQACFPFELVIGEDCSTDSTRKICEEYSEKYPESIRLLPLEKNLGLNLNFIRTFKECRGKYIAYLEGDDWWITSDKLKKQVEILEREPDVSLVHTNCRVFDVYRGVYKNRLIQFDGICVRERQIGLENVIAEFEGRFRPMKTSTICYRRKLMEEIITADEFLFANPEFPTQDFQLFQEMSLHGRFAFIDEETTVIGLHESISASSDEKQRLQFNLGFFRIGIYLIDKYCLPQKTINIWMRRQLYYFFKVGLLYGERSAVDYVVGESLKRKYKLPVTQALKYIAIRLLYR